MLKLDRIENKFLECYPDRIVTIDSHTQGEPTRLLISGVGTLPGSTMKDKRDYFESRYDHVRMLLTREPRGHRGIMAAVVTEPVSPEGKFGLFYMDARRYPYLCGHATIGAVATLIEAGAKVDPRDRKGRTPLSHAAEMHRPDVINLLLDHGAEPTGCFGRRVEPDRRPVAGSSATSPAHRARSRPASASTDARSPCDSRMSIARASARAVSTSSTAGCAMTGRSFCTSSPV